MCNRRVPALLGRVSFLLGRWVSNRGPGFSYDWKSRGIPFCGRNTDKYAGALGVECQEFEVRHK